ncbi:sulfotransferase family protein [Gloeobacter morelensis]|uniref:Sulfotransferase family protein n=1 Tax=Gloeobacter morelensis MG652769 TaxID=2781736 RepID=A0ABY3PJ79_9CYAN|nr:sulfotransferase family protein [Gloeobacter morelensis]UFP93696.1 sulfotransferase family protein [Gloeobacter morelensis MG652769]
MEIIGAGFGRTGTLSLKIALEMLGFGPCYHMVEVLDGQKNPGHLQMWEDASLGKPVDWKVLYQNFRSSVDWPTCAFYRELIQIFPAAKVLLSVRDPYKWYQSAFETIYSSGKPPIPEQAQFSRMVDRIIWEGTFGGRFEDREHAVAVFNRHIEAVKAAVPVERLLVFEVKEGWEPLCRFLGVAVPEAPFPHANDTAEFKARIATFSGTDS